MVLNNHIIKDPTVNLWINAHAGSGKTSLICERYVKLLDSGAKIKNIVCVTFTDIAAREMSDRIKVTEDSDTNILTLHSFCLNKIIGKFHTELSIPSGIEVMSNYQRDEIYDEVFKSLFRISDLYDSLDYLLQRIGEHNLREMINEIISNTTRFLIATRNSYMQKKDDLNRAIYILGLKVIEIYENQKILHSLMDYNDILSISLNALKTNDYVRYSIVKSIDYFIVDEAQDLSMLQWEIINSICSELILDIDKQKSVMFVGDDKQSIYSFQGSSPLFFKQNELYYERITKEANRRFEKIVLDTSYRSPRPILKLVDEIFTSDGLDDKITFNKWVNHQSNNEFGNVFVEMFDKPEKDPYPSSLDESIELSLKRTFNPESCSLVNNVSDYLEKLLETHPDSDVLVLYRNRSTFNNVIDKIKNVLLQKIKEPVDDKKTLLSDILSLLRFIINPSDDKSVIEFLRSSFIALDEDSILAISVDRVDTFIDFIHQEKPDIYAKIDAICKEIEKLGCRGYVLEKFLSTDYDWSDLINTIYSNNSSTVETILIKIIENYLKYNIFKENYGRIKFSTIHGAKGTEADVVILFDFGGSLDFRPSDHIYSKFVWFSDNDDEKVYYRLSKNDTIEEDALILAKIKENNFSEDLRLLYVAMTRAKKELHVLGFKDLMKKNSFLSLVANKLKK